MSRFRMLLVSGFVFAFVGGHLFDAWKQQDHWPFSCYPMFARINKPEPFTSESLWGVTPDGREVPVTSEMTGIMGTNRIRPSLMRLYVGSQRRKTNLDVPSKALEGLLQDYEKRRQRHHPEWPELSGMKFYQYQWEYDPWARNRDTPVRTVLFETPAAAGSPSLAPSTTSWSRPALEDAPTERRTP